MTLNEEVTLNKTIEASAGWGKGEGYSDIDHAEAIARNAAGEVYPKALLDFSDTPERDAYYDACKAIALNAIK